MCSSGIRRWLVPHINSQGNRAAVEEERKTILCRDERAREQLYLPYLCPHIDIFGALVNLDTRALSLGKSL